MLFLKNQCATKVLIALGSTMARNYSKEFIEHQVKPQSGRTKGDVLRCRCDRELAEAIRRNVDNPSEWMRIALENAARDEGWL